MNISGTFSNGALAAREAYMERYYPEIADNNRCDQCGQTATETNFADYSRARRLELIEQQEAVDHLFPWTL